MRVLPILIACALAACMSPAATEARQHQTSAGPVEVTPVVTGLDTPWSVAFLPDGRLLITERDGVLWLADPATGRKTSVSGLPEVYDAGQGGLLDVAVDPGFADNRLVFLTFSDPATGGRARTAAARATLSPDGARLADVTVIFRQDPPARGTRHFGSRIVFDGEGNLFITTGDRGDRPQAQENNHIGKLIRITKDGAPAPGNPDWGGQMPPEVYSIGHRNMQGATLGPDGHIWTISHGARGGDEINRPEPGKNYGWPIISYGVHYSGGKIGVGTARDGLEQPRAYWDPSIAPAGAMIYSGRLFPDWQGDIFTGSLKFAFISRVDAADLSDGAVNVWDRQERLFDGVYDRIRDVREGPDGAIWFLAEIDGTLYRVTPAE